MIDKINSIPKERLKFMRIQKQILINLGTVLVSKN